MNVSVCLRLVCLGVVWCGVVWCVVAWRGVVCVFASGRRESLLAEIRGFAEPYRTALAKSAAISTSMLSTSLAAEETDVSSDGACTGLWPSRGVNKNVQHLGGSCLLQPRASLPVPMHLHPFLLIIEWVSVMLCDAV